MLDFIIAAILLVIVSIPLAIVMVVVWATMGWPVFFLQTRTGYNGLPFTLIKFRTMANTCDSENRLLPDQDRLSSVGRFLRLTSLDELPELINVLLGEMSLVGPRPLLPKYDKWFTPEEALRFNVRPGITGLAQVNGRNTTCWDKRLAMDAWYVRHWSLMLDLKILMMTIVGVISRSGVEVAPGSIMLDLDEERMMRGA